MLRYAVRARACVLCIRILQYNALLRTCVCTYSHAHAYTHARIRSYMHTYMHTHMHTYIHTYTHTVHAAIDRFPLQVLASPKAPSYLPHFAICIMVTSSVLGPCKHSGAPLFALLRQSLQTQRLLTARCQKSRLLFCASLMTFYSYQLTRKWLQTSLLSFTKAFLTLDAQLTLEKAL